MYFSLLLKASVSASFGVLIVSAKDIGTPNQTEILGFSGILCGRTWLLIAPVIVSLSTAFDQFVSLTVFGVLGAVGGISMIVVGTSIYFSNVKSIEDESQFVNKK